MGLYDTQRQRLDAVTAALRDRELEHERARKMALEARLSSLEARLQPHFMFNTLNAISALIQETPTRPSGRWSAWPRSCASRSTPRSAGWCRWSTS